MQQSSYFSSLRNCLRKIAAILFLFIFFFNLCGYRILITFMQTRADQKLETLIDNNEYNDAELIEMRVALNMPYQQRYTEFERHYGEINIDGKVYSYVKRKIEGDLLILKCIPNEQKQELKHKSDDITKSNTGGTSDTNKKNSSSLKIFGGEYDDKGYSFSLPSLGTLSVNYISINCDLAQKGYLHTPQQPPDFNC